MPELPEVEYGRKVAHGVAVGRTVARVWVADDDIVIHGCTPAELREALAGAVVVGTGRHGKHLWLELDRRPWPMFHFGMTGAFRTPSDEAIQLETGPSVASGAWPPRFAKIHLWFDDGAQLVMTNSRRLGRIRLRGDPSREAPVSKLGFDPLRTLPRPEQFRKLLARRGRAKLKGLLLDQSFAAGVGNWIADEVLYQAGLDPRRTVGSLDDAELTRLRSRLRGVIKTAVRLDARKERFPKSWLFAHRWGRQEGARTARGEAIEFLTVAGRTTAWVPAAQS